MQSSFHYKTARNLDNKSVAVSERNMLKYYTCTYHSKTVPWVIIWTPVNKGRQKGRKGEENFSPGPCLC
jgi:hypothetical protein